VADQLGTPGLFVQLDQVSLSAGSHSVTIQPTGSAAVPGSAAPQLIGPLMLVAQPDPQAVSEIAPRAAHVLCHRSLDWLEIVR